jgi:hypothetical protein
VNEDKNFFFKGGEETVTTRASLVGRARQDNAKKLTQGRFVEPKEQENLSKSLNGI